MVSGFCFEGALFGLVCFRRIVKYMFVRDGVVVPQTYMKMLSVGSLLQTNPSTQNRGPSKGAYIK